MAEKLVSRASGGTCDEDGWTRPEVSCEAKELPASAQANVAAMEFGFDYDYGLIDTRIIMLNARLCCFSGFDDDDVCLMADTGACPYINTEMSFKALSAIPD